MDFIYILLKAVVFIVQQIHEMMREIFFKQPKSVECHLRFVCVLGDDVINAQSLMRSPKRGPVQKLRPVLPGHPERLCGRRSNTGQLTERNWHLHKAPGVCQGLAKPQLL